MTKLTMRDLETTPEASKPFLEKSFKANGRIPGLHGVLANSPELLEGYQKLHELFINSSFDKEELTVVWQTINVEHECYYCVPAHTGIANKMQVDLALTEALRDGKPMPTEKLQALQDTTLQMVRKRGVISDEEVQVFFAAGYGEQQLLEIILGLSKKSLVTTQTASLKHRLIKCSRSLRGQNNS